MFETGQSSSGEDVYKHICIECHGPEGAKINMGSITLPFFIGDLMATNQSRMVHHLEFGNLNHERLLSLEPNLVDADLINITKYLQAMPLSSTILKERVILQLRDFEDQGNLDPLLIAAVGIFVLVISAYVIVSAREKRLSE